ncbi:MAG TPA: hypothetical protein HA362_08025 [Nanoarchaeota archaeon]|nr:hypothetical protein [Nanoarchaeota archaeon]
MGIERVANGYKKTDADPAEVWADTEMDALRREKCLCRNCGRKDEPKPYASCPAAAKIYAVCVERNMAMAITRCGAVDANGELMYQPLEKK